MNTTAVKIPCCLCGTLILANAANKCGACLAAQHDIASIIQRGPAGTNHDEILVHQCRQCRRFQRTEKVFQPMDPESPELLALCLKKIPALSSNQEPKLHIVDAGWIWTEPHSMRFKVHITVRYSIDSVPVQQRVMCELRNAWKQCPDCNREYTNRTWQAVLQLRQQRSHKSALAALEMAIAKHKTIRKHVLKIDAAKNGFDFYFLQLAHAQQFASFLQRVGPMRVKTSQKLVSTDVKSNTANIKHTVSCDLVPMCRDDLVLISKGTKGARLAGRLALVRHVKSVLTLMDASPRRDEKELHMDLGAENYYKNEKHFSVLLTPDRLTRFVVLDVELCDEDNAHQHNDDSSSVQYRGPASGVAQFALADVLVAREADFGVNDTTFSVVTHLGHLIQAGDTVLGYDLETTVGGDWDLDDLHSNFVMPDVVLVKKVTDSKNKNADRNDDMPADDAEAADASNSSKKRISKKKERRRARKEGKKMKELEESAVRMGFFQDDENFSRDFEQELEADPELKAEMEQMERAFDSMATHDEDEEEENMPESALPESEAKVENTTASMETAKNSTGEAKETDSKDSLSWDDLCLDPHADAMEAGREEGRVAGTKSGFQAGSDLGRAKGVEYGMELGFCEGIIQKIQALLEDPDLTTKSPDSKLVKNRAKIEKSLVDLQQALQAFPEPSELFAKESNGTISEPLPKQDGVEQVDSTAAVDVRNEMQRIRAKFKVLMVQLGMPHLSIKQVMDQAGEGSEEEKIDSLGW